MLTSCERWDGMAFSRVVSVLLLSAPGDLLGGEWSHGTSASVGRWLGVFDLDHVLQWRKT